MQQKTGQELSAVLARQREIQITADLFVRLKAIPLIYLVARDRTDKNSTQTIIRKCSNVSNSPDYKYISDFSNSVYSTCSQHIQILLHPVIDLRMATYGLRWTLLVWVTMSSQAEEDWHTLNCPAAEFKGNLDTTKVRRGQKKETALLTFEYLWTYLTPPPFFNWLWWAPWPIVCSRLFKSSSPEESPGDRGLIARSQSSSTWTRGQTHRWAHCPLLCPFAADWTKTAAGLCCVQSFAITGGNIKLWLTIRDHF